MTNHTPPTSHTALLVNEFLRTKDPVEIMDYCRDMLTFFLEDCQGMPDRTTVEFARTMTGDEFLADSICSLATAWHLRGAGPMPDQAIARTVVELLTQLT